MISQLPGQVMVKFHRCYRQAGTQSGKRSPVRIPEKTVALATGIRQPAMAVAVHVPDAVEEKVGGIIY